MIRDVVLILILVICAIILIPGISRLARSFWDWVLGKSPAEGGDKPDGGEPPSS